MNLRSRILPITLAAVAAAAMLTGCSSDADTARQNLSTAAEQFEINRRITIVNGITDKVEFEVEGRCSVESGESMLPGGLEVACKIGPNEYVKHFAVLGDNGLAMIQQLDTTDVSVYHHRIIIKPENLLPEFDYEGGEQ